MVTTYMFYEWEREGDLSQTDPTLGLGLHNCQEDLILAAREALARQKDGRRRSQNWLNDSMFLI